VDPHEYAKLHKELIESCRSLVATSNEVEGPFYQYLEDLARPWLSPRVLTQADREILFDLWIRCRQAERDLEGRKSSWPTPRRAEVVWLLAGSLAVALVWLGVAHLHDAELTVLWRLRAWSDSVWFAVKRSGDVEKLLWASVIMVVASIVIIVRTARG
jgi:hypothetical protein